MHVEQYSRPDRREDNVHEVRLLHECERRDVPEDGVAIGPPFSAEENHVGRDGKRGDLGAEPLKIRGVPCRIRRLWTL